MICFDDPLKREEIQRLFSLVCEVAGDRDMIENARADFSASGVLAAVDQHDDDALFRWLMAAVSYQGIGDVVATNYMDLHGRIDARQIATGLSSPSLCPKLQGYWTYVDCRYHKGSSTCAEPEHFDTCSLPGHDLRNGRLNQTAYALFLFFRDVAQGDFVGWVDQQLGAAGRLHSDGLPDLGRAVLEPLSHVHGISDKVLSMALADLFMAAGATRPLWLRAGVRMVAVDSLVHNWLHRTGVLEKLGCDHPYGARCYADRGCAAIISVASMILDAREFNPAYPVVFPRFVQKAIWWFCAQNGFNQCNGNRIDDRKPCQLTECPLVVSCEKVVLTRI